MKYWYKLKDKERLLEALNQRKETLIGEMGVVYQQAQVFEDFYNDTKRSSVSGEVSHVGNLNSRIVYNMTTSIVNHATAAISRTKPKPTFSNHGMNFMRRSKVKSVDKSCLKILKEQNYYQKSRACIKQALISDIGVGKIYPNMSDDTVDIFQVNIKNIAFEKPYEGMGTRNEIVEKNTETILGISEMFKGTKHEEAIGMAIKKDYGVNPYMFDENSESLKNLETEVDIYEIFKSCKGGRHIIFTEKMILVDEPWDCDFLPYEFFYWEAPTEGMIGRGIISNLTALQWSINVLVSKLNKSIDVSIYPYILAHINARVGKKFNNKIGNVVEWQGTVPPTHITPPIAHPQVFAFLDQKIDMCFKLLGMDQTQAQRGTPTGANKGSGVALKAYRTLENSKFYCQDAFYEEFTVGIAKKIAYYCLKYNIKKLKDRTQLDKDLSNITTWPTALFPYTPEGQAERAATLINLGVYSVEEIADIFEYPNVSKHLDSKGKRISAIYSVIEDYLLDKDEDLLSADPVLGFVEQKKIGESICAEITMDKEFIKKYKDKYEGLLSFIAECSEELKRIEQQRAQQLMQGAGAGIPNPPPNTTQQPGSADAEAQQGTGQSQADQQGY